MKLRPETIKILQAGHTIMPVVHEVDKKTKRQLCNLLWEIIIVAASAQGVSVDELNEYLLANPNVLVGKNPPNKAINPTPQARFSNQLALSLYENC